MAPPERVSFASLAPRTTLPPTAALEGEVVSVRPFSSSARTAALSLAQAAAPGSSAEPLKVQVELRGAWAQHAAEQLAQLNGRGRVRLFAREGECARVELVPVRAGGPAADVPEGRRLKVVFERGIQGRWVVGEPGSAGKGQDFDYRAEARSKHRLKPLAHSLSDDEVVEPPPPARQPTFAERNNLPSRPVAGSSRDKLVVPTGNPHSPWIGGAAPSEATAPSSIQSSTRAGQPVASSSRSSSGEPKTKKKRENREVRTTWGLSSSSTNYIYTALDTLPTLGSSGGINIIAMAVVARPTLRVEGGSRDWGCILGLHDPTTATSNFKTEVKYFGKREEDVPVVQDGDIIVIQGLNWKKDNKKLTAYKDKGHYFVLPSARLLDGTKLGNFKPPPCRSASLTDAELSYARDIARWARKHALLDDVLVRQAADSGVAPPNPPAVDAKARSATFARGGDGGRKLVTVEEVCADTFCDIQGEIVKFYKPFGGTVGPHDACSLFITDYTTNDQLYAYSDTSEVRTPGQVTFQVSIFGNQNDPLLSLSEDKLVGRLVHLRNVRPKMTAHDFLEATMVEDPKYENRRDVTLCRSGVDLGREWHEAFKQRRTAYWASLAGGGDGGSVRATGDEKPLTAAAADPLTSLSNTTGLTQQSISSALALKAEGMYRFRARVIDFYPDRLEDWVRAFCPTCGDELSASETTCIDHGQVKHEWSFLLALADEQDGGGGATDGQVPHVFVPVAGDAGDALLPNFTPSLFTSLRFGDSSALSTLTSRLRGILGTILETKRRKKPVLFGHAGPAWDVVLEATKEDDQLRWFFAPGRVAFR
ncbi:uncharacterized protein RHOBADRAFT_55240 [Rhodotorula graminis WP1]|uniref:Protection of telomeres protein 1 n=1 Tax=Rhodotorula graminis (strain WP1) TaxID=578459 RepID=A0A0P9EMJ1_RHOGW|nr:uncharacterized protein RHOBADRAFT_55240 [Rhodotorula graminis WP1]KPV72994.1 hypothetical protein RHOBADRAFT_55240 [Rhodotorula graminis WP1]